MWTLASGFPYGLEEWHERTGVEDKNRFPSKLTREKKHARKCYFDSEAQEGRVTCVRSPAGRRDRFPGQVLWIPSPVLNESTRHHGSKAILPDLRVYFGRAPTSTLVAVDLLRPFRPCPPLTSVPGKQLLGLMRVNFSSGCRGVVGGAVLIAVDLALGAVMKQAQLHTTDAGERVRKRILRAYGRTRRVSVRRKGN